LQLAGARFNYGVGGGDWPWLTGEFGYNTHDRWNGLDVVSHTSKVLALIEVLGTIVERRRAPLVRRSDLSKETLSAFGIAPSDRYVLLHMGARVAFSRWPHYLPLAERILAETDYSVVAMTEDRSVRAALPTALAGSGRFSLFDERLDFDSFDAFVSHAACVVGNDSGPKHLSALRGTPTVTLFTARINWSEWGQEDVGAIISRRVPCAGCAIFHDHEECGKNFSCIRDITVNEVFATVKQQLESGAKRVPA
jgi:ADP-heptose:LPS heptosyltransferase